MPNDEPPLQVDPNPTPKAEAEEFENIDERFRAAERGHELAILAAKKGWIGIITGSTNESMNTGLFLLLISLLLLGCSMIGSAKEIAAFNAITDNLFKFVLTLAGYIFGTSMSSKS